MNESLDRVLADWLDDGPETGPREGMERALAATRRVGQRPGWTLPERWLPMELTVARTRSQRPILAMVTLSMLIVALVTAALYVGSQRLHAPLFRNGAVVWAAKGDLFIADQLGGTPRSLVSGSEEDSGPVFSPQGDRVAFVRSTPDGTVTRVMSVRPDGSALTELAGVDHITASLAWAPDGSAILVSGDGHVVRSVDGADMSVSPDNRSVYIVKSDGSGSRMLDAGTGVTAGDASWRPDGRHIAFMGWQGATHDYAVGVFVADADGTNVHRLAIDPGSGSHGVAWSPDGMRLSFKNVGGTFYGNPTIADIDVDGDLTGSHVVPLDPRSAARSAPQWSPDGSHLAALFQDGAGLRVGIFEPDGSGLRVVGPAVGGSGDADLAWSPDGRSVAVTGSVLGLDPVAQVMRWAEKTWSVDVATGEQTEVRTPVESWQRSAP